MLDVICKILTLAEGLMAVSACPGAWDSVSHGSEWRLTCFFSAWEPGPRVAEAARTGGGYGGV